ncbi:MAG: hypothetical protein DME06_08615 [Candidatus Rokuibacteriota bacterium]|nr:MAG: hypothetical protein DME06_08615 [Candidatus Rokubacteria bacterium]
MRRRFAVLAALLLMLAGCSAATLRNAETGKTISCGTVPLPFFYTFRYAEAKVFGELRCLEDAQRRGYEYVPVAGGR